MEIRKLEKADAPAAAQLHIAGQQGTFLTALGEAFLTAFYAELAESPLGYGFTVVEQGERLGVVAGTSDTSALFKELILKRGLRLAWPVAQRLVTHPGLLPGVIQNLFYPSKLDAHPGEAELLFIGVRGEARRRHVGTQLIQALIEASRARGATALKITVDVGNAGANAFYVRNGLHVVGTFALNGRQMNLYRMALDGAADAQPALPR